MGCGSNGPEDERVQVRAGDQELYLAPAGEAEARVRAVLPTRGSEDASGLLEAPSPEVAPPEGELVRDYLPDPATEWVLDVRFAGDPRLDPERVADRFGTDWRKRHGSMTTFALDPDTGRWTYLISADGPKQVTRLKLAWSYLDALDDDPDIPSPQVFTDREAAVREAIGPLGVPDLTTSLPPDEAAGRAGWLRDFKRRLDYSPMLGLRAPEGERFEGREIWDVMLCLGLEWGDMDVFHWVNPGEAGEDSFFSVWTSTLPGYFFPEEIAAGNVRVGDLVFGFSAPRCSRPGEVLESMVRAIRYAQKRLGGTIVDETGSVADVEAIRRKVRSVEREMKANGFTPGGESALHLF